MLCRFWLRTRCVSAVNVSRSISGSPAGLPNSSIGFPSSSSALHDAKRAAIDCRAEKPRDGRVAEVLKRQGQRRELILSIASEPRIEKLEPDDLLTLAAAQANGRRAQLVHEIDVRQLHQTERAGVGRKAAAVFNHPRLRFFHVDDDVVFFLARWRFARGLLADQNLAERVGHVQARVRLR